MKRYVLFESTLLDRYSQLERKMLGRPMALATLAFVAWNKTNEEKSLTLGTLQQDEAFTDPEVSIL